LNSIRCPPLLFLASSTLPLTDPYFEEFKPWFAGPPPPFSSIDD
jgi:hypothetical protein